MAKLYKLFFLALSLLFSGVVCAQTQTIDSKNVTADKMALFDAFSVARIIHGIFDAKPRGFEAPDYQKHFATGPLWPSVQSKSGYLIISCFLEVPMAILTPCGTWPLLGWYKEEYSNTMGELQKAILNSSEMKLKLISPALLTNSLEIFGPWYLVTEINGNALADESVIPDFEGNPNELYEQRSDDYTSVMLPRLKLLESFYKEEGNEYSPTTVRDCFGDALKQAYENGVLVEQEGIFERARNDKTVKQATKTLSKFLRFIGPSYQDEARRKIKALAEGLFSNTGNGYFADLFFLIYHSELYKRAAEKRLSQTNQTLSIYYSVPLSLVAMTLPFFIMRISHLAGYIDNL
ncbi:MAG: hypothetical protein K2X39_02710 [Silvanigrellaceae bacterium]|nr:hypothetical protein [Silvanigrellaceae bacterium]